MPLHSRLKLWGLVLTFFWTLSVQARASRSPLPENSGFEKLDFKIDKQNREAHLYDPREDRSSPRPLLIVFHGAGGTALGTEKLSGLKEWAQKRNFLLLYPQGLDKVWNDGRNKKAQGHADIEFFDQILLLMKANRNIDDSRVYVAGMSNGGLFSFRLACERSERIQGMASIAANMGEDLSLHCRPSKPSSVLIVMGSKDPLVPFEGGEVTGPWGRKKLGRVLSSEKTLDWWVQSLKCSKQAQIEKFSEETQNIRIESKLHAACSGGHKTKGIFLYGAGHTWPSGWQYLKESIIGKTSRQISASEEIVKFFNL